MPRLHRNIWLGAGVMLFALALVFAAIPFGISTPKSVRSLVLSPILWPTIIGWCLFLGGALLVAQQLIGRTRPEESGEAGGPRPDAWLRLGALALLMAGYYIAIPLFGMVWASALAFLLLALLIRTRYRVTSLIVAFGLPLVTYAFFYHVAGVPIPQGEFVRLP
ncbi:tripartite tricarboxylate transporter TctB family protein [Afifella pfennigii]|uniref:tripartite tricarboxylate transporter TctB family protein n=1 Tax=Afifella pfennigii TaxID=209897 RepID=UPI00047D77DE|nr:tripartite tricarboxylate transporter TctB family protein [Afifella pfennigii]